jgi:hypothetical protein
MDGDVLSLPGPKRIGSFSITYSSVDSQIVLRVYLSSYHPGTTRKAYNF